MDAGNVIHGLWVGRHLSRLEQLTLRSFVRQGHAFNLWVYDELDAPVPEGVTLHDAAAILPRERIFRKAADDPTAGLGKGSLGPFSDLFRYKLLHDVGGVWVDMDVTCLRPFAFTEPYLFRPHRIGVVGNLIKAPRGSELMRVTYEDAERVADENVSWLTLNRILCNGVYSLGLEKYIRKNIVNEGSLTETIMDFAGSEYKSPPHNWYGIHWGNEYWGTRPASLSEKNGRAVTKDEPAEGSLLRELYRSHGLIDPRASAAEGIASPAAEADVPESAVEAAKSGAAWTELEPAAPDAPDAMQVSWTDPAFGIEVPAEYELPDPSFAKAEPSSPPVEATIPFDPGPAERWEASPAAASGPRRVVAMMLPTLAKGGAERIVVDIAARLTEDPTVEVLIYAKTRAKTSHPVPPRDNLKVVYLNREGAPSLVEIAGRLTARGTPLIFTHLIERRDLAVLWNAGLLTVPVIHNSRQGWGENPSVYDHVNVPFVIACAESVRAELEAARCPAPVITLRHEISLAPTPDELAAKRKRLREDWGIDDDTLLIGMIGQFKTQKAYTRAVRVLARLQEFARSKLMIVGGWDHKYGAGRTAYEATVKLAVELGVVADVIMAGETRDPVPYLAAFDVFLNTSIFEGLSISIMEATACGCPLVVAAVGGIGEIAPADAVLVDNPADTDAYVAGILQVVSREVRALPPAIRQSELVPQLWMGLNQVTTRLGAPRYPAANGSLMVIDGLHLGGPATSLVRFLVSRPRRSRAAVFVVHGVSVPSLAEELERADVDIVKARSGASISRVVTEVLDTLVRGNYASVCFWNAAPEIKLMLGKLLAISAIKLIDVSPGPMLFDELEAAVPFQKRIAFSADQYLQRLDHFIALHKSGLDRLGGAEPRQKSVIPLGVPMPPRYVPLPAAHLLPPEGTDPALAIGTVTRLVPYKKLELLLEAMALLKTELSGATLTIVGGPDVTSIDYASELREMAERLGLDNVRFVGPYAEVNRFLALWQVFVLAGERQGSPNASLEAMAMGLPVVAFDSGGLREQVVPGRTGYVVETPRQMADRVKALLRDPARRQKMGERGRARVQKLFGLENFAAAYAKAIGI